MSLLCVSLIPVLPVSSPCTAIWLASLTALVIAERIRAALHGVVTAGILVASTTTSAAYPETIQFLQAASAKAAIRAGQTSATGTRVVQVNARVAVLLVVI